MGVARRDPRRRRRRPRLQRQWSRALTRPGARGGRRPRGPRRPRPRRPRLRRHDPRDPGRAPGHRRTPGRVNVHAGALADDAGRVLAFVGPPAPARPPRCPASPRDLATSPTRPCRSTTGSSSTPTPSRCRSCSPAAPRRKGSVSPRRPRPPRRTGRRATAPHRAAAPRRRRQRAGAGPGLPAIAEIVDQTSSLVHLDQPMRRLAAAVEECGGGAWPALPRVRALGRRGRALLDREPRPVEPYVHHPGGPTPVPGAPDAWSREPWRDAVEYAEELVVMVDDQVRVLAGLGPLLWLALERPRTRPSWPRTCRRCGASTPTRTPSWATRSPCWPSRAGPAPPERRCDAVTCEA